MLSVNVVTRQGVHEGSIAHLKGSAFTVVDCHKPTAQELKDISEHTDIPINELKEAAACNTRPRSLDVGNYVSLSFMANCSTTVNKYRFSLVTFYASYRKNNIIIIRKEKISALSKLLHNGDKISNFNLYNTKMRLMFKIIAEFIRHAGARLEDIEDELDRIEKGVFRKADQKFLSETFHIKKALIIFHREYVANREALNNLALMVNMNRHDLSIISDLKADCSQVIDSIGIFREILNGTMEVHLSVMSNNMNQIMKRLTGFGGLIMIPTLIASVYGMNFKYMPELNWKYGYLGIIGLMFVIVIVLYSYFKKNDWI